MLFVNRCICIACVLRIGAASPPGLPSSLYGYLVGNSDFEMNLIPPYEEAADTKEKIDALVSEENIEHMAAMDTFTSDKQKMLSRAKIAIHDVVEVRPQSLQFSTSAAVCGIRRRRLNHWYQQSQQNEYCNSEARATGGQIRKTTYGCRAGVSMQRRVGCDCRWPLLVWALTFRSMYTFRCVAYNFVLIFVLAESRIWCAPEGPRAHVAVLCAVGLLRRRQKVMTLRTWKSVWCQIGARVGQTQMMRVHRKHLPSHYPT